MDRLSVATLSLTVTRWKNSLVRHGMDRKRLHKNSVSMRTGTCVRKYQKLQVCLADGIKEFYMVQLLQLQETHNAKNESIEIALLRVDMNVRAHWQYFDSILGSKNAVFSSCKKSKMCLLL